MPNDKDDKEALDAAKQDLREGKAASTAAGEFIREEMHHIKEGKHGGDQKMAVAIGLSKAREAGIPVKPRADSPARKRSRASVKRAHAAGQKKRAMKTAKKKTSRARARSR